MPPLIDLTGQRFGRLIVVSRAENVGKKTAWLCRCDCGNTKIVHGWSLKSGQTRSCGCLSNETRGRNPITHGQSYTRLYTIWIGMKQRCYYQKHKHFKRYGGRGIAVCDEWRDDFRAFHDWSMANGYEERLTIDRIDNDGNYAPSNCRWATYSEQANNMSSNRIIEFGGEKRTIKEWSKITGIPHPTITGRLNRGWTIERALNTK